MLRIGSEINGYTVIGAWLLQRAERPDHVVILGHDQYRSHGYEFVVGGVNLDDAPTEWDYGTYSSDGQKAFEAFLRRTELSSLLPEPVKPTGLDAARAAYYDAAKALGQAAEASIKATIHQAFPDVAEVTVVGEYNEDGEIRLSLEEPDGVDPIGWETTIEGLEEMTYELVMVTGDDWQGTNTLSLTA